MEGPNLTQHEVIKFLTLKGGRCTNFELVSNFRGALNHPQHQAEARLRFKDIVNTVGIVGEFQNIKFIELKKEYRDNNIQIEPPQFPQPQSEQPSSLSSDSGSSYSSPLTQSFQPYWRYRLSSSTKVPSIPVRNPDYETYIKPNPGEASTSQLGRSVSESILPQTVADIQPPPRTRGRSVSSFNRSISEKPAGEIPISESLYRKTNFNGQDNLSRRSSINGYPPETPSKFHESLQIPGSLLTTKKLLNQQPLESISNDPRRNSEVFVPGRPARAEWPPSSRRDSSASNSEYSSLSYSRSFSGSHGLPDTPLHASHYNSSNSLDKWNNEKLLNSRNGIERSPKRTGICSDEMLRALDKDTFMDTPVSTSFNRMHGIAAENSDSHSRKTQNSYTSLPEYSYSHSNKNLNQSTNNVANLDESTFETASQAQCGERDDTREHTKPINRNLFPNANHQSPHFGFSSNNGSFGESNLEYDNASIISSSSGKDILNINEQNRISGTVTQESEIAPKKDISKTGNCETTPPVPPERRRKQGKGEANKDENDKRVELPNSVGKVKDRVQHFDDLEKRRSHPKRGLSPLPDKENRSSKSTLMEDDVSISVLDSKLKREWFVKAAQGDYYALVGLLKKEPRLAAIKDITTTALHWGAKHGDANIVKLITGTYRVNPNIRTNGYTAIHIATMYKHTMLVDLLVHTYGADPSIRDYSGKRADQYPDNYVRSVAGLKTLERRPLKDRPAEKESTVSAFMRIGSLNLRKSRKSAVFASVRGRNWGSATELRLNSYKSTRKKNSKNIQQPEKKCDTDTKNDSDSDSAYGFYSK